MPGGGGVEQIYIVASSIAQAEMPTEACMAEKSCRQCAIKSSMSIILTALHRDLEMIDNDGAATEHALKQTAHKRQCYSRGAFVPVAHQ